MKNIVFVFCPLQFRVLKKFWNYIPLIENKFLSCISFHKLFWNTKGVHAVQLRNFLVLKTPVYLTAFLPHANARVNTRKNHVTQIFLDPIQNCISWRSRKEQILRPYCSLLYLIISWRAKACKVFSKVPLKTSDSIIFFFLKVWIMISNMSNLNQQIQGNTWF